MRSYLPAIDANIARTRLPRLVHRLCRRRGQVPAPSREPAGGCAPSRWRNDRLGRPELSTTAPAV